MTKKLENENIKKLENISNLTNEELDALTLFRIDTKESISDNISNNKNQMILKVNEMIFKMFKQMSSARKIIYLSEATAEYQDIISTLDGGNNIFFYKTKPNQMLIDSNEKTTELFDEISSNYQNAFIVIDNIDRYIAEPFNEDETKSVVRKNKLLRHLVESSEITKNNYIVIDNLNINLHFKECHNVFVEIITKQLDKKEYNTNSIHLVFKNDNKNIVEFTITNEYKKQNNNNNEVEYILSTSNKTAISLTTKKPQVNTTILTREISKRNLLYGDNLPITIKENGISSKTLTKATIYLTIINTNYEIPILCISPFDKIDDIKYALSRLNSSVGIDKKAIKRTSFYTIEKLSNEEKLGQNDVINNVIKRELQEFSQKIGNKPFITLIDVYDKESYNFSFDYNLVKILSKAYDSFTIVAFLDKNTRYLDINALASGTNNHHTHILSQK